MDRTLLEVKYGVSDDYEYAEAIKTLRTNIQFCGSGIRCDYVYQFYAG